MNLSELIKKLDKREIIGDIDVNIDNISYDSRNISPNSLFFAIRGLNHDGHKFINEAINKGAIGVISERKIENIKESVVFILVDNSRKALGAVSAIFYGDPSSKLSIIGITGTNGKTTISYLIESILNEAGLNTGIIGTINYRFRDRIYLSVNTTPESLELQRILKEMLDSGISHVIMEVSSHAIHQGRVDTCNFDVAVFTNITRDHLDYHGDMESYFWAKKRLFNNILIESNKRDKYAVINIDDRFGREIIDDFQGRYITYGKSDEAIIKPENINLSLSGIDGKVYTPKGYIHISSSLIGEHNLYNILAAIGVSISLNISIEYIVSGINNLRYIPGRMERIENKKGYNIFVDYAHTPDALEKILSILKHLTKGRLITVFGCGGDRDKSKRPLMGSIASKYSDISIVTSDNPRSEDPEDIISQIEMGINIKRCNEERLLSRGIEKGYISIVDRRKAIEKAIMAANPDDTVIIAGKGHEDYQIIRNRKVHFDDREEVRRILNEI
jgi:UDP-N-acetylmuramoyl-L-alanyl-D-glutamate--2,6-diaminopimelate ligase